MLTLTREVYSNILSIIFEIVSLFFGMVICISVYTYFAANDAMFSIKHALKEFGYSPKSVKPTHIWKKLIISIAPVSIVPLLLLVLISLSDVDVNDFNKFVFQTGVIAGFLAVVITIFLTRTVTIPIKQLVIATEKVRKGNLDQDLTILSNDETGLLTQRFNEMTAGLKERDFIKDTFGKFISPQLADIILNSDIKPGGEEKDVSVLFADIRNFTTMSEHMPAGEVVSLLNKYFDTVVSVIHSHNGIVNKFIGDGLLAFFGEPFTPDNHTDAALESAISMQEQVALLNRNEGLSLQIGIGIHSGQVVAGNIGCTERMEYTIIGDTVNLASRIETATKSLAQSILFSEQTFSHLSEPEQFSIAECDTITVKGRKKQVKLYSIKK